MSGCGSARAAIRLTKVRNVTGRRRIKKTVNGRSDYCSTQQALGRMEVNCVSKTSAMGIRAITNTNGDGGTTCTMRKAEVTQETNGMRMWVAATSSLWLMKENNNKKERN